MTDRISNDTFKTKPFDKINKELARKYLQDFLNVIVSEDFDYNFSSFKIISDSRTLTIILFKQEENDPHN